MTATTATPLTPLPQAQRRERRPGRILATVAHHTVLVSLTAVFLAPVLFVVLTALMSDQQALTDRMWPNPFVWSNFTTIFELAPLWRFAQNTLLIAVLSTIGVLVSCVPVAYALSLLEWKGRRAVLFLVLATYMLPAQATVVPLYIVFAELGWTGSLKPLIIPAFFANAFDVFLLRQFFLTIPSHLTDAARVEGASEWRVLTKVVLPLAKPALAAVALLHFVFVWNDLFSPLLYLGENRDLWTLTLGLSEFRGQHSVEWNLTMAASVLYILPIVVLFLFAQRWVLESVKVTGRGLMATLELDQITKVYGKDIAAVHDVSLTVGDGELITLVGPSGCGKSTILRLIAGLEELTAGEIRVGGQPVSHLPPGRREVAMVFQQAAVFPHLDVAENIGFGLRLRRRPRAEVERRVAEVAALLRLDGLLDRRPDQLSGGQRQRVAIGRALLREPHVSLMDEPLSSLDARLRSQMRTEIGRLQRRAGTTTVYVTHDQAEAVTLGDRVAVMRDGRIEQVDAPREVYARPASAFVAGFIGTPAMNLVQGTVVAGAVQLGDCTVPLPEDLGAGRANGAGVLVGIRPTALVEADGAPRDGRPLLEVTVEAVEHLGGESYVLFALDGAHAVDDEGPPLLTAKAATTTSARPGARVQLTIDPTELHLFDPETGQSLRR